MKKRNKIISFVLASFMICATLTLKTLSVNAEGVIPHNYSVEIIATKGGTSYFSNSEKLIRGENFTVEYTVESLQHTDPGTSYRHLAVIGFDSLSKMYPDPSLCSVSAMKVNGSVVSAAATKNLPETYFKTEKTYAFSFVTTDGGANYSWTAKCGDSVSGTGTIPYHSYFGICAYGFGFELKLTNVNFYTETSDLGVYAYNNGEDIYSAKVVDLDAKGDGRNFTAEDYIVENADVVLEEAGYLSSNAIKVTPKEEQVKIYLTLPEIANAESHKKVHVAFRLNAAGKMGTYDDFVLSTWGEKTVDYAYPRDNWNYVNFDTQIFEKDGKNAILVQFDKAFGETLYLSDIVVNDDIYETDNLLGGIVMYQLESQFSQMEGYIMLTPEGQVVVVDGGDVSDTENFLKLLRQFTNKVDAWFISHYHCDHLGTLVTMLKNYDVTIDTLYYDFRGANNAGFTGDSDNHYLEDLDEVVKANPNKVKKTVTIEKGDVYRYGSLTMKVLNDGYFGPGNNQGNDTTVVFKMETPEESVLFLGDLGARGDVLLNDSDFVKEIRTCRIVQMAHHGQNGVSDAFYKTIDDIRVCLYSAPRWLYDVVYDADYENQPIGSGPWKTLKTRSLMRELGVRASYTAIERVKLT